MTPETHNQTIVSLPVPAADATCGDTTRRRRGKVAQLPKAIRDKINAMLEDGLTYARIIDQLSNDVSGLTASNLSNWQAGGYQDYLRHRDYADALRDRQEKFLDAATDEPVKLADAGMQIAATGLCELLDELSRLQSSDEKAADRYARIANAMARLARTILTYEQHRRIVAKEKANEVKLRDPNKPFGGEDDYRAVVDMVDRVFGLRKYRKKPTDAVAEQPVESPDSAVTEQPNPALSPNDTDDRASSSAFASLPGQSGVERQQTQAEPAPLTAEPQTTPETVPPTPVAEDPDERPWNWEHLSEEYIANWQKERRERLAAAQSAAAIPKNLAADMNSA
jgi:hypothetical protein